MIVSKERARIVIDSVELILSNLTSWGSFGFGEDGNHIRFKVCHAGVTDAFIIGCSTEIWYGNSPKMDNPNGERNGIQFPKILKKSDEFWKKESMSNAIEGLRKVEKSIYIHFRVVVRYADAFQTRTHWEATSETVWLFTNHRNGASWLMFNQRDGEKEHDN